MQKILLSFLFIAILVLCFSQDKLISPRSAQLKSYNIAAAIYKQAEQQLAKAGNDEALLVKADELYQHSLSALQKILPAVEKTGYDSLVFMIKIKTGFINNYFGNAAESKKDYLAAMAIEKKMSWLPDSLLFIPSLYTGGIYYSQDQFDSAFYYYKKAEQINDTNKRSLGEVQRLFNRLGAMYYEMGNYRQAKNYFEKAIAVTDPANKELLTNYRINKATLLIKLGEFSEAKPVFEELLHAGAFQNEIYHNLGIISQKENDQQKAISYFRKVHYDNNKKQIDLLYNFAISWSALGKEDSAAVYILKALKENTKWYEERKSIPHGLILKFRGDELLKKNLYKEALINYQQAILQFHHNYTDTSILANPRQFNGVYSFINLFTALTAKAGALEKWWRQEKDIAFLELSLRTYQAAFNLAAYVERTYNSDEARLFLGEIKYNAHNRPIGIGLQLYELTHDKQWLEFVYLFDQQNKASALALTIRENELRFENETTNGLVKKEAGLKTDITRLLLKAANIAGLTEQDAIAAAIGEKEIELNKLQDKLNEDPEWIQKRSLEQIPTVEQLQKKLDNQTVLLSYHLSATEIVTLYISQRRFDYKRTAIDTSFFQQILALKNSLYNTPADQRYDGDSTARYLYAKLLGSFGNDLKGIKRLIIIPDDELNYLPFEALQDENKEYLIENFSVQYHYSAALLGKKKITTQTANDNLSFAPFTAEGFSDSTGSYSVLPASKNEVIELPGKVLMDKEASKENFLTAANHYSVLHLATHASVNNDDPSLSYIAFYPGNAEYKLYAKEIAGLRLDSTDLIILSACETGAGQLVKGEGLMSLSRAFAYAGCPNVITSLWKAEDNTTAFLTKRLHYYLDKNYSKDKALQQAKIDWLHSKETDPRFKSPNYWAHLIFIGDYERASSPGKRTWIFIIAGILLLIAGFFTAKSLFVKNKQARSR